MAHVSARLWYEKKYVYITNDGWGKFTDEKDDTSVFDLHGNDEDIANLSQRATKNYSFEVNISYPKWGSKWWDRSRNEYIGVYGGSKRTYNVELVNGVGILRSQSGNFYSYVPNSGKTNNMTLAKLTEDFKTMEDPGAHLGEILIGAPMAYITTGIKEAWTSLNSSIWGWYLCEGNSKEGESGLVIELI
ncbi:hypothetical protein GNF10_09585 [Nostoc sp. UCD121]|uniref:hypothetical protein n=1 Tax=unclassified Nostoc TaxID=2593658 RepID=UPI0016286455|nr:MULTISPECIES: hypothetical protein [unclassified Nostoc]MBC1225188.1 hypothetical protein [Nostoc sp. UCD120]MBC1276236.1 hypothetical protein [Nostoc sp. UCD121]